MFSFLFPNMKIRSTKKELMDFEDCDTEKLIKTVAQFRLLNMLFSSSNSLINKYIFTDIKKRKISEVNFLDIGAGGCDIPIWFLKKCKKIGIKASITCIDSDERITEYAIKVCKNFPDIKVIHGNAFDLKLHGKFDYIFTNHFLHHIDDQSIPSLLSIISESCNNVMVLNDLKRSNLAYFGYTLFTALFIKKSFAFYDGRLSIQKGFTKHELTNHIQKSKAKLFVKQHLPARLCVVGKT